MKKLLFSCLMMLVSASFFAQNSSSIIEILPQSELTITGDTNINKFKCNFDATCLQGPRKINYSTDGPVIAFENALLVLQNANFDCGNRAINKDFHSLLQTKKYPDIFLDLKKIKLNHENSAKAEVKITIAGKHQNYTVPVEVVNGKNMYFKGKLKLNINDFGLEPPKKLFGAIVVKEDIEINFNLTVKN